MSPTKPSPSSHWLTEIFSDIVGNRILLGYLFGILGVMIFSMTPIATKLALESFSWQQTLIMRWNIACLMAWGYVAVNYRHLRFPKTRVPWIVLVSLGVVVGFPFGLSFALQKVPAGHSAVFIAGMPLATTFFSMILGQEKPRLGFWVVSILGAIVVAGYSLISGAEFGSLEPMDIFLFGAISCAGLGYAASGKLVKTMGGLEVVVWGLVIFSPIPFLLLPLQFQEFTWTGSGSSWFGVVYIGIFSQWLGFYAWNRGLKWGGTSKVSQVALFQSFLALLFSSLILGEEITKWMLIACILTITCVVVSGQMKVEDLAERKRKE